jgi:SAM-dependent methyltransferase
MSEHQGYNTAEEWSQDYKDWRNYVKLYSMIGAYYTSDRPITALADIGCGVGKLLDCCVRLGMDKSILHGLEGEDSSYEFCLSQGFQVKKANLEKEGLPWDDNSMDVIVCNQLIEHISKAAGEHLLDEMYRILRPGGVLIIYTPSHYNITARTMPFHLYCWKPSELKSRMQQSGFRNMIPRIAPMKWYDYKKFDRQWHLKKYAAGDNAIEKLMFYGVYALYKITRWEPLLNQAAFIAYK